VNHESTATPEVRPATEQLAESGNFIVEVTGYEPVPPESETSPEAPQNEALNTLDTINLPETDLTPTPGSDLITYSEVIPLENLAALAETQSFEILAATQTTASPNVAQSTRSTRPTNPRNRQGKANQHELLAQGKTL
jgi:hypothetical protein